MFNTPKKILQLFNLDRANKKNSIDNNSSIVINNVIDDSNVTIRRPYNNKSKKTEKDIEKTNSSHFELSTADFNESSFNEVNDTNINIESSEQNLLWKKIIDLEIKITVLNEIVCDQQKTIEHQNADIIKLNEFLVGANETNSMKLNEIELKIISNASIINDIRVIENKLFGFEKRMDSLKNILTEHFNELDSISKNFTNDINVLSNYFEKLNRKFKSFEKLNCTSNSDQNKLDIGCLPNNNVADSDVHDNFLVNFESKFTSFNKILCNGNYNERENDNSFSLDIRFHKFVNFSKHIEVTVNVNNLLIDKEFNICLIKSKVLRKINAINSFKICSSIDKFFINKIDFSNDDSKRLIKFITFIIEVDFPLNFQFFAINDNFILFDNAIGFDKNTKNVNNKFFLGL